MDVEIDAIHLAGTIITLVEQGECSPTRSTMFPSSNQNSSCFSEFSIETILVKEHGKRKNGAGDEDSAHKSRITVSIV